MEEGSRRTKGRRFIVEVRDNAMNRTLVLYVYIESKSSAFSIRGSSGEERDFFGLSPMVGWLSLDQDLLGLRL